jgi:hypothetical protein
VNRLSVQDPEHVPDYRQLFSLEERGVVELQREPGGVGERLGEDVDETVHRLQYLDEQVTAGREGAPQARAAPTPVGGDDIERRLERDELLDAHPFGKKIYGPVAVGGDVPELVEAGKADSRSGGSLSRLMVLHEEYVTGSRSTSITSSYRVTPHVISGHEEHRGAVLSRSQPGHRVPALLSAERIEGRPVHDRTAGQRRGQLMAGHAGTI